MIVLGADTHKRSHTIAAVAAASGELLGEQTVLSGAKGAAELLRWARGLGDERVWAIEDCRHVSGSLERFLIERGERVLRVHSTLMSVSRRQARGRGKSDSIDALAVARAALREGLDTLPAAHLDGPELDLRLLVDHRERLVRRAGRDQQHAAMASARPLARPAVPGQRAVSRQMGAADRAPARPGRADDARPDRARRAAPHPRAHPDDQGAGSRDRRPGRPDRAAPADRARLRPPDRGQARRRDRRRPPLRPDAKLARAAGIAPIPVSSGNTSRHRLDRGGNRQINATIHRIAVTRLRCHPETKDYIARKRAEGKSTKDAIRCLKRHLTRRIWHLLQTPAPIPDQTLTPSTS